MTTLGKVLAFVNFVFAVVTGGLIIMVYVTSTNWKNAYDQRLTTITQIRGENAALGEQITKLNDQVTAAKGDAQSARDALDVERKMAAMEITKLNGLLTAEQALRKDDAANAAGAVAAKKGLEDEVQNLHKIIKERETQIVTYAQDNDKYKSESVRAQIEVNSLKDRLAGLTQQLEYMARDLERSKSRPGTAALTATTPGSVGPTVAARVPPPEDVEGLVKAADSKSGLVTISIGSDAGLSVNNTLEVFRMKPPTYLGTIRIVDVRAHEAVGQMVNGSSRKEQVQVGDNVASNILGGQRR